MGRPEWLDLAVLNIGRSPALFTVKTLVMTASFAFVLEFARRSLNKPRPRVVLGLGLTLVLLSLLIALGLWRRLLWLDVAARCLLGSQLPSAQATSEKIPFLYALGLAGIMLILVPSGLGITETLGRQALFETLQHGLQQTPLGLPDHRPGDRAHRAGRPPAGRQ